MTAAQVIDGKAFAAGLRARIADAVPAFEAATGRAPGLAVVLVGDDPKSRGAIAFGVTGAPESFIVDKAGIIRYKHIGVINEANWNQTLFPIVQKLRQK